jgi:hypothetical protein
MERKAQIAKIIQISDKRRERVKNCYPVCLKMIMDRETELLECEVCGRYFTGFNWLLEIYRGEIWLKSDKASLSKEVKELENEKAELVKTVGYLKRKKAIKEQNDKQKQS